MISRMKQEEKLLCLSDKLSSEKSRENHIRTMEEKVLQMKSEFISIISHELRTPLSSIVGFVEILLYREVIAEKQKRYYQTIYNDVS